MSACAIQIAAFDLGEYQKLRSEFTTDEWIDLMLPSTGYEPAEMSKRLKLLFLTRLIPLCERNFNLFELGPRGTGNSYVIQEISPYAAIMTGPTTVANLFGHMGGKTKGLIQIWDVGGFDEVADHRDDLKGRRQWRFTAVAKQTRSKRASQVRGPCAVRLKV